MNLRREEEVYPRVPIDHELKNIRDAFIDLIENGKIVVRGDVEDDTVTIFLKDLRQRGGTVKNSARERVKVICAADGAIILQQGREREKRQDAEWGRAFLGLQRVTRRSSTARRNGR